MNLQKKIVAQNNSTKEKTYYTQRINSKINLDGVFNETSWSNVDWSSCFTKKANLIDEKYDTKFKIIYNKEHLYVAIQCLDASPDSIPMYPSPRDNPSNDWIEIDFDSNYDKKTGYAFVVSPYGVRTDMFITGDDEDFDDRWHPSWSVKTTLHEHGWNAEMKIPFDQMELSDSTETWGMQLTRRITRKEEYTNWQPMPNGTKGWVSKFGKLIGINSVKGKTISEVKYAPNKKISIKNLQEDIEILKNVLENIYPDLYWFSTKNKMDSLFANTINSINKPLNEPEFYKKITPIFNAIGDGHSWIRPSRNYVNHVYNTYKILPLGVKIVDNKIIITKNFGTSTNIIKGMSISSINGIKTNDILNSAFNFISADGYNKTWKADRISNNFSYYLSYILGSQESFSINVIDPNSKNEKTIIVDGLLEDNWKKNTLPTPNINYRKGNWNYQKLSDSTGYLSINTFARGQRFRNYIDEIFKTIKNDNIQSLIIDVRDNYGGNDVNGKHLFSYLTSEPFYYYKEYEVNSKLSEENINSIECCISREEIDFLNVVSKIDEDGKRRIFDHEKTGYDNPNKIVSPQHNAFTKDVYLIINGGSFSVTSDFASKFHESKRGEIIGEETGGGYYGNVSGISKLLILPNSKLRANINLIKYLNNRDKNNHEFGRGVLPDFEKKPTQKDIYNGNDTELNFVLELIKTKH